MDIKIGLTGVIFKRSLCLSLANVHSSSQIMALSSKDVNRFEEASQYLHFLWCGPLELVLITYFLYREIGIAAIGSVTMLLLLIPFQVFAFL
jgi:ATP-binding cassette subfamily C (CFTR/MRP) protein 4